MFNTREGWMTEGVNIIDAEIFDGHLNGAIPFRVCLSWPGGRGKKNGVLGQCWSPTSSADEVTEMFVSPSVADPVEVLDILVHENVHRVAGVKCGHRGKFRTLALAVGLEGKMPSSSAGAELKAKLANVAERLGPFPHATLSSEGRSKKQSTRLLKVECPDCGNIARQSAQAAIIGLICGGCNVPMTLV
jgi:ribosomal protein S27E